MPAQSLGFSTLLGMGAVVAAQLVVFLALGLVVDSLAGTSPVFLLVGVFVGVVAAIGYTVMKFRQYLKTPGQADNPSDQA